MVDIPLQVGQTVLSQDGRQGVIRFKGTASFAPGAWLGLELPDNKGKNDGSVKGERFFDCRPGHGIFVRPESIVQIISQSSATTNGHPLPKVNGSTSARPRPSIGVTADVARKRQSLMSSGSTPGSRLSLRVRFHNLGSRCLSTDGVA
jgi:dynactin 1